VSFCLFLCSFSVSAAYVWQKNNRYINFSVKRYHTAPSGGSVVLVLISDILVKELISVLVLVSFSTINYGFYCNSVLLVFLV